MRIALIPLRTSYLQPAANLRHSAERIAEAASAGADLICLPECTLTGYISAEADLGLYAETIPGPSVHSYAALARQFQTHILFCLVELDGEDYYNSAILLDRSGQIAAHHHKYSEKPPYATGQKPTCFECELGNVALLLCGDLFDPRAHEIQGSVDLAVIPMSRCFDGKSPDPERWMQSERDAYIKAMTGLGATSALVNSLSDDTDCHTFGGAMIVDGTGKVVAETPHGSDETLWHILI